ncbi:unnamed protein product [Callosobruchus maculatus]|uniref:Uncharacterized protein n=1 Tax=Callosobruchus maculatus TaxID=64391 RepID=A0A653DXM0_CALMS|nr:unnamed protein product [Callosobruchus maculatus]
MNRKGQVPAMDQFLEFQNELSHLLATEKQMLKRIHFEDSTSSDSEPDGRLLDEDYIKNQPPPCDYNLIKGSIVKIVGESTKNMKKKVKKKKTNTNEQVSVISKTVDVRDLFDEFGFSQFSQDNPLTILVPISNVHSVQDVHSSLLSTNNCTMYVASNIDVPLKYDSSDTENDSSWKPILSKKEKKELYKVKKYEQDLVFAEDTDTCLSSKRGNEVSQMKANEPLASVRNTQENKNPLQNKLQLESNYTFDASDFPPLVQTKPHETRLISKNIQENKNHFQNELQLVSGCDNQDNSIFDESDFPSLNLTKMISKNSRIGVNKSSHIVENGKCPSENVEYNHGSVQNQATSENLVPFLDSEIMTISGKKDRSLFMRHVGSSFDNQEHITISAAKRKGRQKTRKRKCQVELPVSSCSFQDALMCEVTSQMEGIKVPETNMRELQDNGKIIYEESTFPRTHVNIPLSGSAREINKNSLQRKYDHTKSDNLTQAKNCEGNNNPFKNALKFTSEQEECIFDKADFPPLVQKKRFSKNSRIDGNKSSYTVENCKKNVEYVHGSVQYEATSKKSKPFVDSEVMPISEKLSLSMEHSESGCENQEHIPMPSIKKKKRQTTLNRKAQVELPVSSCSFQDTFMCEGTYQKTNIKVTETAVRELHNDGKMIHQERSNDTKDCSILDGSTFPSTTNVKNSEYIPLPKNGGIRGSDGQLLPFLQSSCEFADNCPQYDHAFAEHRDICLSATKIALDSDIKQRETQEITRNNKNNFRNELQPGSDNDVQDNCIFDESSFPPLGQIKRFAKKSREFVHGSVEYKAASDNSNQFVGSEIITIYEKGDRSLSMKYIGSSSENQGHISGGTMKKRQRKYQIELPVSNSSSQDTLMYEVTSQKDSITVPDTTMCELHDEGKMIDQNRSNKAANNIENCPNISSSTFTSITDVNIQLIDNVTEPDTNSQNEKYHRIESDNVKLENSECVSFPKKGEIRGSNENLQFYQKSCKSVAKYATNEDSHIKQHDTQAITKNSQENENYIQKELQPISDYDNEAFPSLDRAKIFSKTNCTAVNISSCIVENSKRLSHHVDYVPRSVRYQAACDNGKPFIGTEIMTICEEDVSSSSKIIGSNSKNQKEITGAKKKKRRRIRKRKSQIELHGSSCPCQDTAMWMEGRSNEAVDCFENCSNIDSAVNLNLFLNESVIETGEHRTGIGTNSSILNRGKSSTSNVDYFYGSAQSQITSNIFKLLFGGSLTETLLNFSSITWQKLQEFTNSVGRFYQSLQVFFGEGYGERHPEFINSTEIRSLLYQAQNSLSAASSIGRNYILMLLRKITFQQIPHW